MDDHVDQVARKSQGASDGGSTPCQWYETQPDRERHERFLRNVIEILLNDAVFDGTGRNGLVIEWIEPEKLALILGKEMPQHPKEEAHILQLVKDIVRYSVKTGHPRFINQLFSRQVFVESVDFPGE